MTFKNLFIFLINDDNEDENMKNEFIFNIIFN